MPYLSKNLTNEVGIQFSDVRITDPSSLDSLTIKPMIIGRFKRGRLDDAMLITQDNIRAVLGHEASNPDYQIVQDYLNTGVPSVYVFRIID